MSKTLRSTTHRDLSKVVMPQVLASVPLMLSGRSSSVRVVQANRYMPASSKPSSVLTSNRGIKPCLFFYAFEPSGNLGDSV